MVTDNVVRFGSNYNHERTVIVSMGTSTGGKISLECVTHGLTPMEALAMLEMAKHEILKGMDQ